MKIPITRTVLFSLCLTALTSCDTGKLKYKPNVAQLGFELPSVTLEENDRQHAVVIRSSHGNEISDYSVYVEVNDPEGYIGDICTISNSIHKRPDRDNGDHVTVYKSMMRQGMKICAILITPVTHPGEQAERTLEFRILNDPTGQTQVGGLYFYAPSGITNIKVTIKN